MRLLPATVNRYLYLFMAMTALTCFFRPLAAIAQHPDPLVPDSLIQLLHENRDDDENRAEAFAKVIDFLFDARCYEQVKPYIDGFLESEFVRQDKYYSTMGDCYRGMAIVTTEPEQAFKLLKKAEQDYLLLKKSPKTERLGAKIYLALGHYYYQTNLMFSQYYECIKKVEIISKELKDNWMSYQIESHAALTQIILVNYGEAISLYKELLDNQDYKVYNKYSADFNMGLIYKWRSQPDSAQIYFEASLFDAFTKQDSLLTLSEIILLPLLYDDYDKVIQEAESHLDKMKEEGDIRTVCYVMYGLAQSYHQVRRSDEAIAMLETCLEYCGDESTYIWLKILILEELKKITWDLHDFKRCCEIQTVLDSANTTFNVEEQLKVVNQLQLEHQYAEAEAEAQYERDMERIKETRKNVAT